jgi:hypothetical protein
MMISTVVIGARASLAGLRRRSHHRITFYGRLHVIAYRAPLDVPRELVQFVAMLLAAEFRRRGTPRGSRALTCFGQAVLGVLWFRDRTAADALARDHGISRATAYRYLDEVVVVLAEQAPELREALERAQGEGLSHVILDGKIIPCDRCKEPAVSVKGEAIDLWYSGKAHTHGGNIQAVCAPDGFPGWATGCPARGRRPGHWCRRGHQGRVTAGGRAGGGCGVTTVRAAVRAGALSRLRRRARLPRQLRRDSPLPRPPTARHSPDRSRIPRLLVRLLHESGRGPDGPARPLLACRAGRPMALSRCGVTTWDQARRPAGTNKG